MKADISCLKRLMPEDFNARMLSDLDFKEEVNYIINLPSGFFQAIARQILMKCKRCGCCCSLDHVAVEAEECKAIASYLEMGKNKFLQKYTSRHSIASESMENCREFKKKNGKYCPFYNTSKKECIIYEVRPQVCRDFPYLAEKYIQQALRGFFVVPNYCPAAMEVLNRVKQEAEKLCDPHEITSLENFFQDGSALPFYAMLYLKVVEMSFGPDKAAEKKSKLGVSRIATEDELEPFILAYLGLLAK